MKHVKNISASEASADEPASPLPDAQVEPPPPAADWPEFASRAEAMAFWQGVRRGMSEAGRDRAHPHMPESFSLDLTRDGASPTLISAKLLDPWPYIADDEASQGLTTHGPAAADPRADRHDGLTAAKEQKDRAARYAAARPNCSAAPRPVEAEGRGRMSARSQPRLDPSAEQDARAVPERVPAGYDG